MTDVGRGRGRTRSTPSAKPAWVSYSRILDAEGEDDDDDDDVGAGSRSHTETRPSALVPARCCPEALSATAQIEPAVLVSDWRIGPAWVHVGVVAASPPEDGGSEGLLGCWCCQRWTSPPKPALTARVPEALEVMWWTPSLWTGGRDWVCGDEAGRGEVGLEVSGGFGWDFMVEEPEAVRVVVGVVVREKMSVG